MLFILCNRYIYFVNMFFNRCAEGARIPPPEGAQSLVRLRGGKNTKKLQKFLIKIILLRMYI